MEISDIHIPHIDIPTVHIPQAQAVIPGCQYTHRDINLNPNLLLDDPSGVYTNCPEGEMPVFYPMDWKDGIKIVEEEYIPSSPEPNIPESPKPDLKTPPPKPPNNFINCPGPYDQRIGDFRNDKKLERISGHKLSEDGKTCITLYEPTNFRDQYIPSTAAITNATVIGLVAASTPLLLNAIKPIVKNLVKKLTSQKEKKNDDEVKPD
tara:strand:+ start:844 stop:1464 length:621 start_codon:yes stop_codon:yes gene_type:complete